jgi:hypothetical protein
MSVFEICRFTLSPCAAIDPEVAPMTNPLEPPKASDRDRLAQAELKSINKIPFDILKFIYNLPLSQNYKLRENGDGKHQKISHLLSEHDSLEQKRIQLAAI